MQRDEHDSEMALDSAIKEVNDDKATLFRVPLSGEGRCPDGHQLKVAPASMRSSELCCCFCHCEVSFVCTGGGSCGFLACKSCSLQYASQRRVELPKGA